LMVFDSFVPILTRNLTWILCICRQFRVLWVYFKVPGSFMVPAGPKPVYFGRIWKNFGSWNDHFEEMWYGFCRDTSYFEHASQVEHWFPELGHLIFTLGLMFDFQVIYYERWRMKLPSDCPPWDKAWRLWRFPCCIWQLNMQSDGWADWGFAWLCTRHEEPKHRFGCALDRESWSTDVDVQ